MNRTAYTPEIDKLLELDIMKGIGEYRLNNINEYAQELSNLLIDKFINTTEIQEEYNAMALLSTISMYEPDSEIYFPIIEVMHEKTLKGFYDQELISTLNIEDLEKIVNTLKQKKLIAENYKIVDKRYITNEEQTIVDALDKLIKEVEEIYKTVLYTSVQKYNQSIIDLGESVSFILDNPEFENIPQSKQQIRNNIKSLLNSGYYSIVNDPKTGLPIYEINPNTVEQIMKLTQEFLGLDKGFAVSGGMGTYLDAETEYLNNINTSFPYNYAQRLGAMFSTYAIINGKHPVSFGEGGTGKTTSIRLAIEMLKKHAEANNNKAINVVILGHTEELLQNPSLGELSQGITLYKEVLNDNNVKDVVNALRQVVSANPDGYNIFVIDEFLQQSKTTIDEIYKMLSPRGITLSGSKFNMQGFFVGDLYQKKNHETAIEDMLEMRPYRTVWRNNNVGLMKAMNAVKAKITTKIERTQKGTKRVDIRSAQRHVDKKDLATQLSKNLVYSDKYGVQPVTEEEFFDTIKKVSGSTKSVVLVEDDQIRKEIEQKVKSAGAITIRTISEFQGLSEETVFFYTKGINNLDVLPASTSLYTAISRARNKVYISNHFFEDNGIQDVKGLEMSDSSLVSADNSIDLIMDRIKDDINAEKNQQGMLLSTMLPVQSTQTAQRLLQMFPSNTQSSTTTTTTSPSSSATTQANQPAQSTTTTSSGATTAGQATATTGTNTQTTTTQNTTQPNTQPNTQTTQPTVNTVQNNNPITANDLFDINTTNTTGVITFISSLNKKASNKYSILNMPKNCII
jgi:hypothetical protein